MKGGLIQLVATGEQDNFLTSNPEITFFKSVYKRHSNFSMETKYQVFSSGVSFGSLNSINISKDGDLISDMSLHVRVGSLNKKTKKYSISNTGRLDKTRRIIWKI